MSKSILIIFVLFILYLSKLSCYRQDKTIQKSKERFKGEKKESI